MVLLVCCLISNVISFYHLFNLLLQRFQTEEHLLIHRHKHEMTLKFSSIKTDVAFTGKTCRPTSCKKAKKRAISFQHPFLIKVLPLKLKCKVRENSECVFL